MAVWPWGQELQAVGRRLEGETALSEWNQIDPLFQVGEDGMLHEGRRHRVWEENVAYFLHVLLLLPQLDYLLYQILEFK